MTKLKEQIKLLQKENKSWDEGKRLTARNSLITKTIGHARSETTSMINRMVTGKSEFSPKVTKYKLFSPQGQVYWKNVKKLSEKDQEYVAGLIMNQRYELSEFKDSVKELRENNHKKIKELAELYKKEYGVTMSKYKLWMELEDADTLE